MAVNIKVTSDSRQAQSDLKKLEASLQAVEKSSQEINRSISKFASITKFAFTALPLTALAVGAVKTAASFEKLSARLDIVTGSSIKTAAAFAAVNKLVKETPFSVQSLTDAYARLALSGNRLLKTQGQLERAVQNIADSVSAVGGSNQELTQVAEAFQKMAGEGRITARRLDQISTAGIPLTKIADALGITMEELRKETERGNLTFEKLFVAFQKVSEAADGFGGAAAKQVNTLNGAFSNLGDAIANFSDKLIRQSGVSRILAQSINAITATINNLSDGIEISTFNILFTLTKLFYGVKDTVALISSSFEALGNLVLKFTPKFDINLDAFASELRQKFANLDISVFIKPYVLKLGDFLPGLEDVKNVLARFGKFVKDVFFDIYDAVIGNSYWTDLIEGVVALSAGLLGRVKPYFDAFKSYIEQIFIDIKTRYDDLFTELKIKVDVSSESGILKDIANYLRKITEAVEGLINSAKQYTFIQKLLDKIEQVFTYLVDIQKQIDPVVWASMTAAFDSITIFTKQGLPRLLSAIGLGRNIDKNAALIENAAKQYATDIGSAQSKALAEQEGIFLGQITLFGKEIGNVFDEGIVFSKLFTSIYEEAGAFIGRSAARIFGDETARVFTTDENIRDAIGLAVLLAVSKAFRKLFVITVAVDFLTGENSLSEILAKIFDQISNFGNKVLQGAGIQGFDSSLGGFIAGILFGGLTIALVTGKLAPILASASKAFFTVFVLRKIVGPKQVADAAADAAKAGLTIGQKFSSAFNATVRTAGLGVGVIIGASIADDIIANFGIEDGLTKLAIQAGIVGGAAYAGSFIAGALATFAGAKLKALWLAIGVSFTAFFGKRALAAVLLAAVIPTKSVIVAGLTTFVAAIAGALSLPVILTALGITAGGSLLYYLFFGAGENTILGKFGKLIKESIFLPLKNEFLELFSWIGEGITKLLSKLKRTPENTVSSPEAGLSGLGFSSGGKVRGPGSGTSDDIVARLSNGEFVVNAKATSQNRDLLERINRGLPAFASGGFVSDGYKTFLKRVENEPLFLGNTKDFISKPELGTKTFTIGYGHLLEPQEQESGKVYGLDWKNLKESEKKPFAEKLLELDLANKYVPRFFSNYPKAINTARKRFNEPTGKDSVNSLNQPQRDMLMDYNYNPGLTVFPLLTRAVTDKNREGILANYKRSFTDATSGIRKLLPRNEKLRAFFNDFNAVTGSESKSSGVLGILNKLGIGSPSISDKGFVGNRNPFANVYGSDVIDYYSSLLSEGNSYFGSLLNSARLYSSPLKSVFGKELTETLTISKDGEYNILSQELLRPDLAYAGFSDFADFFAIGIHEYGHVFDIVPKLISNLTKNPSLTADNLNENILKEYNVLDREYAASKTALGFTLPERLKEFVIPELVESLQSYLSTGLIALFFGGPNIFSGLTQEMLDFVDDGKVNQSVTSKVFESIIEALNSGDIGLFSQQISPFLGFATGGAVRGPGSGTSDDIVARLSNGEYVVNAKATSENRAILDYINQGGKVKKFAQGTPPSISFDSLSRSSALDLSDATPTQLRSIKRALDSLNRVLVERSKLSLEEQERFSFFAEEGTKILETQIAPFIKRTAENTDPVRDTERDLAVGDIASKGFESVKSSFQQLLASVLKGEIGGKAFFKGLVDNFTSTVVDSFAIGVTEGLFRNIDDLIKGLFGGIGGLGFDLGNILGFKRKDPTVAPDGTPEKPLNVKLVSGIEDAGLIPDFTENIGEFLTRQEYGTDAGSEQTRMLAEQMEGFNQITPNLFSDLTGNLSNIFTDLPGSLSGVFDTLTGSFNTLFSGLFSGGGSKGFSTLLSFLPLASGGYVSGPGTGTSDSILARLSNGEYVINASSASKYLPLLEAINSNRVPAFAVGGLVDVGGANTFNSAISTLGSSSKNSDNNSSQQVFNINITGDVSEQTKKEIYQMLPQIANGVNSYNREKLIRS